MSVIDKSYIGRMRASLEGIVEGAEGAKKEKDKEKIGEEKKGRGIPGRVLLAGLAGIGLVGTYLLLNKGMEITAARMRQRESVPSAQVEEFVPTTAGQLLGFDIGDGRCEGKETSSLTSDDCGLGSVLQDKTAIPGNGKCESGESSSYIRTDCGSEYNKATLPTAAPNVLGDMPVEDVYSMGFSRATLYDGSHNEVVRRINSITGRSKEKIFLAWVYDYDNTLEVQYEGEAHVTSYAVESEEAIDQLMESSEGYRHESLEARAEDFIYALSENGLSVMDYANLINQNCSEKMEAGELAERIRKAALISLVPGNGRYPLLNIVGPGADELYTFYAKDSAAMDKLLDAAMVPE